MNVAEIKAKLPEAEVYCIDPEARYLVVLDSTLVQMSQVEDLANSGFWPEKTAFVAFKCSPDEAIKLFEIRE